MIYAWLALAAILGTIVFTGIRYRPALWRWLVVLELLSLLWLFSLCFVPGSWRQFWEFAIPLAIVSGAAAIASSVLQVRNKRVPLAASWPFQPQMIALYAVFFVIGVMIVTH